MSEIDRIALEWFNRAESNFEKAKTAAENKKVYFEDLCFDLQQSVEKALKAVLVKNQVVFPKTHSISLLIDLLNENNKIVPNSTEAVKELSNYAVITRYPGDYEPVTKEDYLKALSITKLILHWSKSQVQDSMLF